MHAAPLPTRFIKAITLYTWYLPHLNNDAKVERLLEFGCWIQDTSQMSSIESNDSQNGGLEDYRNNSDGIFPHFSIPSIKIELG